MTYEHRYTFEQAAAKIGVRADDLPAMLQNIGIAFADPVRERGILSGEEVAHLARFKGSIDQIHKEGTDSGVDD